MENNRKPFFADKKRIHCSNINLYKSLGFNGMVGTRHSELISRLSTKIQNHEKENKKVKQAEETMTPDAKLLKDKIQDLQREENNLKREMLRIN